MIVVDASVVVELVLRTGEAEALAERLLVDGEKLYAPELLDIEVAQVVRRYWQSGDITQSRGAEAINDLADLPITRVTHAPLLDRIWQLRENVTAYDAAYIALAEALDVVLITRDRRLGKVSRVRAIVEVV